MFTCNHIHWRRDEFESGGFSCHALHFFGSTSTISRFRERCRDGQYSLASFLFVVFQLTVPPCPAIC